MTKRHGPLVGRMLLLAVVMFGFGFALVPLYNVFCQVTGLNGKTGGPASVAFRPEPERTVWVELLANVNTQAPWSFRPAVTRIAVHPGELYTTRFLAENPSAEAHTVQAVPSVAPGVAARLSEEGRVLLLYPAGIRRARGPRVAPTLRPRPRPPTRGRVP